MLLGNLYSIQQPDTFEQCVGNTPTLLYKPTIGIIVNYYYSQWNWDSIHINEFGVKGTGKAHMHLPGDQRHIDLRWNGSHKCMNTRNSDSHKTNTRIRHPEDCFLPLIK